MAPRGFSSEIIRWFGSSDFLSFAPDSSRCRFSAIAATDLRCVFCWGDKAVEVGDEWRWGINTGKTGVSQHGGTPIAGWFIMEHPKTNRWFGDIWGYPHFRNPKWVLTHMVPKWLSSQPQVDRNIIFSTRQSSHLDRKMGINNEVFWCENQGVRVLAPERHMLKKGIENCDITAAFTEHPRIWWVFKDLHSGGKPVSAWRSRRVLVTPNFHTFCGETG